MIKRLLFSLLLLCTVSGVFASHFRYGNITWTRVSETPTTVTIRLNVSLAWRLTAAPPSASFAISGGPTTGSVNVPLSNVTDPSGGWTNSTGSAITTLTKSASIYKIAFNGGNKISGLQNNNGGFWNVFTLVNTNAAGSSPVSTLPAIINMPVGAAAATYTIPASDPDPGSTLSYRLATGAEMGGAFTAGTQPSGLTIDPATGQITFNTLSKTAGQLWNADVIVTDNDGNQIMLDFLINMVGFSNPPAFDYTTTPTDGFVYNVIAGQNISFPIKATDPDAGSTVSLSVSGLPSYITTSNFSPAFPATGNPSQTTFSWTPGAAQIGTTNILNIVATDNVGVQNTTSVTIKVVAEPAPVFINPTPGEASITQIGTGVLHQDNIVAQSSLGSNVSIAFATVPSGAVLSPAVPTTGANPGQTTLSWTPTPADFGTHNLSFQAVISSLPTIFATRSYSLIVNTPPAFSSTPSVLSVNAGQTFSYNVTVTDPDIPYGDVIDIAGTTIPSWLTLTSTGNGTAVLSGTPAFSDGGINHVELEAEDTYHHGNPSVVAQSFDINVITCIAPAIVCPSNVSVSATAGTCGAVVNFAPATTTGTTVTYSIASGTLFAVGTTTVTVTATNDCGTATCSFDVTVIDNESPAAIGKDVTVYLDATGHATLTAAQVDNGSSDNCGIATRVLSKTDFDCSNTNVAKPNKSALRLDGIDDWVQVNGSIPGGNAFTFSAWFYPTNGNNGKIISSSSLEICVCSGAIEVYTPIGGAFGASGLTMNRWHHIAVAFNGSLAKVYIDGQLSFFFGASGSLAPLTSTRFGAHAFVNCCKFPGILDEISTWNVALSQSDITNMQTHSLAGSEPGLTGYWNFDENGGTIAFDHSGNGHNGTLTNMTGNPWVATAAPVSGNSGGATTTLYVTDVNGNQSSATVNVTVVDAIAPVISCPSDISVNNDPNTCGAAVVITNATATDNCTVKSIAGVRSDAQALSAVYPIGSTKIVWTATDASGNTATCTQTITVTDNENPVISIGSVTVNNDAGACAATVNIGTPVTGDNCGVASVVNDHPSASYPVGTTIVIWTVTDVHGNSSTATQTITVTDNEKPVISIGSVTVNNDAGVCAATVNIGTPATADNCGVASVVNDHPSANYPVGTTIVTWTVTDIHGNTNTTTQTVVVTDNELPVITNPSAQVFCANADGSSNYTIPAATATDNCGVATVSYAVTGATTRTGTGYDASGAFNIGVSTITWTVTDIHGNVNTNSTTVTVNPLPVASYVSSNADAFCNQTTLTASSTISPASYSWISGNSAPGAFTANPVFSLGQTNGDGIYSVFVKADATGCISAVPAVYNYQKQNLASSYTILAYKEAELGSYNRVASGSVGVMSSKGEAEFKSNSTVASPGSFVKAVKIETDKNVTIAQKVYAAATPVLPTMIYNTASTKSLPNYEVKSGVTVTLNANYGNLNIKKGAVVTLTGTIFGTIHTEEGAQLTFTKPVISIDQLQIGKGPKTGYTVVKFAPNTSVLVSKGVSIGDQVYVNPDNYKVTFYVGSQQDQKRRDEDRDDDAKFSVTGRDIKVTANVVMPLGKLKVNGGDGDDDNKKSGTTTNINMTGLFIATEVESEAKSVIWNSFDCGSAPVTVTSTVTGITQSVNAEKEIPEAITSTEELKITVMPNPSTTYFTLKLESKYQEPVSMKVMDGSGRVVDARSKVASNGTIQIGHNYSSGTYYAEMIQGARHKVVQLIKVK